MKHILTFIQNSRNQKQSLNLNNLPWIRDEFLALIGLNTCLASSSLCLSLIVTDSCCFDSEEFRIPESMESLGHDEHSNEVDLDSLSARDKKEHL